METSLVDRKPAACALPRRHAGGSSLIEVLIALIVLAIGLLGLAGTLATAMASDRESSSRAVAVQRANDAIGRMRANPIAMFAGGYLLDRAYADIALDDPGEACSAARRCAPAELAARDLADWNAVNASLLPSGRGSIAGDPARGFRVSLMWLDPRHAADGVVDPSCGAKSPPEALIGMRCLSLFFVP